MNLKQYIKNPKKIVIRICEETKILFMLPDDKYLKIIYRLHFGKKLDLNNPQTYNEKLQWLKLYNRKDIYTKIVDKYKVKEYVSDRIGEEYVIPSLGIWKSFDEIEFDKLPNQFVLKCTHDSGGLFIVKDKNNFNKKKAKRKIEKSMKRDFYKYSREWPYKNVERRIIAEEYMEDDENKELRDYKFFVFDGKVKLMYVASNRQGKGDTYFDYFDVNYNHLDLDQGHLHSPVVPQKPKNFDEMIKLSEKLGRDFLHVRVDFYEVNGKTYFGEMTFYSFAGVCPFNPEEWDYKLGEYIELPGKIEEKKEL